MIMNIMLIISRFLLTFFFLSGFSGVCQTRSEALSKINTEGFQNSQVMNLVSELSDVYGPRLTGTDQYYAAAKWAKKTLENWSIDRVYFENFCNDCMGWEVKSFNVEMIEPAFMKIQAYPYAWTESSNGVQTGDLVWIENYNDLEGVKRKWGGRLKGKVVLIGPAPEKNMLFGALSTRFTEEQIEGAKKSIVPVPKDPLGPSAGDLELIKDLDLVFDKFMRKDNAFFTFLKAEGAVSIVGTNPFFPGIIHPSGTYNFRQDHIRSLPYFAISPEHFGKLKRLIERNTVPKIKFSLDSELYLRPENNVNIMGEIIGSDPRLKDEVVMIGAHFDSWHSASGATDNGAGSAVMMEVMRIIKVSGLNHVDEGNRTTDIYIAKDWKIVDDVQRRVIAQLKKVEVKVMKKTQKGNQTDKIAA